MLALLLFAFLLAGIFVFLTQIWCQSRLYGVEAHPRSQPTKRTSAAQRCNEDALRLIFELCSESTLASAGCVCQQWMIPAQKELFSSIASSIPPRRSDALSWALIDAPRLRSYIRRVTIFVVDSDGLKRYSWLRMLPPYTLVSLELNGFPTAALHLELANLLLTSSSLSTLRRLVISRPALGVPGVLEACCSSSFLEHLGVIFLGGPVTHSSSILPFKRNLSRLSLRGPDFVEEMSVLIRACGASLRWLDVELTHWPRSTGYTLLAAALREVPQLEYLYLRWPESHPTPFLDGLSTLLPNLRVLDAGAHVYTATLFSNLPPMLEILRLKYTQLYSAALPNDMVDYAYFPAEAAVAGLSAHSALHTFTLSPSECSFIEFPALVTSRKALRCRIVTPDCVQAKTLDLLGEH